MRDKNVPWKTTKKTQKKNNAKKKE